MVSKIIQRSYYIKHPKLYILFCHNSHIQWTILWLMLTLCKIALSIESRHMGILVTLLVCFFSQGQSVHSFQYFFFTSTNMVWVKWRSGPVDFLWEMKAFKFKESQAEGFHLLHQTLYFSSDQSELMVPSFTQMLTSRTKDILVISFPTSSPIFYSSEMFEVSTSETGFRFAFLHFHKCCPEFTRNHFPPALLHQNILSILFASIFVHYLDHCQI